MKKLFITMGFIFLALLINAQLNFQWAKGMGGVGADIGNSIAVDASGNVYSTGTFSATVDFDPGPGVYTITSTGNNDVFVSKLDASGNFVWAKKLGGINDDDCRSIAVDASGNVYTTGTFSGTADFDPNASTFNLTAVGFFDGFVCKLNASGAFVWAKAFSGTGVEHAYSLALDASGNVYTTGDFSGTTDFDPGASVYNITSAGGNDIFVSKLDALGNFVFAKGMGGVNPEYGWSIFVDGLGNVYTTGGFYGVADFDPGAGTYTLSSGGATQDVFISKLNSTGAFVWAKSFVGPVNNDRGNSITVDVTGNVYTAGYFNTISSSVDFDPGPGTFTLASLGSDDAFVSKLDASGNFVWAKQLGGTGNQYANSIALDGAGNVYTTGFFLSTADFDPGVGVYNLSANGVDMYLSKLDASGSFIWAQQIGGTNNQQANSMALDNAGNIYITGVFDGPTDFDPGVGTYTLASNGNNDVLVEKLCQTPSTPSAISGNTVICAGSLITYTVPLIPFATSYTWSLPGGWTGSSTSNTITVTAGTLSGTISVMAGNACGTSSAQTISIMVNPNPTVSATTSSSIICGPPFQQTATLTANGANTYTWNPGGTGTNIAVSPTVTTNYTVTGTDANGCKNTAVITQSVSTCSGIDQLSESKNELTIFPNPFNSKITIVTSSTSTSLSTSSVETPIQIYNVLGSLIYSGEIKGKTEIDLGNQSAGIYFVRMGLVTKKIVKE